ncbi:hypothetical protein PENTCL1PPCAC_14874, partial [Pristionchus entomophagus]
SIFPAMSSSESTSGQSCLVCGAASNYLHLGMDVCRACASFFKRAEAMGRKYPCRKADGNCIISKADGLLLCRGCRFDKCVAIGMAYEGPLRPRRNAQQPTLLQRMGTEYKALCERRRNQELKLARSFQGQRRAPHPTEEIYIAHVDSCYSIFYASGIETFEFFNNVFPAFEGLGTEDQVTIFKDYVGKFNMYECYERTRRIWGQAGGRYTMWSMVTCCDLQDGFDGDTSRFENTGFIASFVKSFATDQNAIFLPLFNRVELTEQEGYALMTLVMSETDTRTELSEAALQLLDQYRAEALEDLQVHYRKELGLDDFSRRLGNLMTLNHTIQECKSLFKVFFRFFATMFDTHITSNMMSEMLV